MKCELLINSCRICFEKPRSLRTIYVPLIKGHDPIIEMIKSMCDIHIEALNEQIFLPKKICSKCYSALKFVIEFREKIIKSNNVIKKLLKNINETQQTDIKATNAINYDEIIKQTKFVRAQKDINNDDCNAKKRNNKNNTQYFSQSDSNDDDDDDEQTQNNIKTQNVQFSKSQEIQENVVEIAPKIVNNATIALNNTKTTIKTVKSVKKIVNLTSINAKSRQDIKQSLRERIKKPISQNVHNKVKLWQQKSINPNYIAPNVSTKSEQLNYIRFICDICGNIFTKRGRMMEHRRRHNKELSYTCEICNDRFSHREKLRRHLFLHSGGRPIKCNYCSRTFYYESVKKAHESIHTGVKLYVCKHCDKSFAYAHTLKKHELIHADIKAYHCDYCAKDFRLVHHLKQHLETNLHQAMVHKSQQTKTQNTLKDQIANETIVDF